MEGYLFWITGFSGAGKTSIAECLLKKVRIKFPNFVLIDGNQVRELFGNDLGYDYRDRLKNAWRIANLCHFLTKQGLNVICSTVSLFNEIHSFNRDQNSKYVEILVQTSLETRKRRDKRGLYSDVNQGKVVGFDMKLDLPQNPHLILNNDSDGMLDEKVSEILKLREF